jgi:large subunit ribosomal protein L5
MTYIPRLQTKYKDEVAPKLQEQYNYKSVMQVPKLTKICLNQGVKGAVQDKKMVVNAVDEMTIIAGQKAVPTLSKKDISNFKLRSNMPIGTRVTLRAERMYEFLDRLISVSLPRVRDLMEEETSLWVSQSKSFSLRLYLIKLLKSTVWILRLLPLQKQTKKHIIY